MTSLIRHVVAGVGLTDSSLVPLREALRIASRFGARVSAVNVHASGSPAHEKALSEHLASITVPEGVTLTPLIAKGSGIAATLATFCKANDAQLLCVGPRPHGFVERHITGGPAEQLITRSSIPVLVVREESHTFDRVLVALDFSAASAEALRVALTLASPQGTLSALHVLSSSTGAHRVARRDLERIHQAMLNDAGVRAQAFLEQHLTPEQARRCAVDVRIGATGHQILDAVERFEPHLVCMGTIGRRGLHGLFAGNTAERMVQTLSTPLLVAQPPAD